MTFLFYLGICIKSPQNGVLLAIYQNQAIRGAFQIILMHKLDLLYGVMHYIVHLAI